MLNPTFISQLYNIYDFYFIFKDEEIWPIFAAADHGWKGWLSRSRGTGSPGGGQYTSQEVSNLHGTASSVPNLYPHGTVLGLLPEQDPSHGDLTVFPFLCTFYSPCTVGTNFCGSKTATATYVQGLDV